MSARIGIGAAIALLVALALWAAWPTSVAGGADVAPPPEVPLAGTPIAPRAPAAGDVQARVDACRAAQAQVAAQRAARGGPAPAGQASDAGLVAAACAPLFADAGCRQAQLDFDRPPPEARAATVLRACVRAYCPALPAPKPSVCTQLPADGMETFVAWSELRDAILRHDLGPALAAQAFPSR